MQFSLRTILVAAICLAPFDAWATKPKLDPDACNALRLEQIKFRQSGILDEMSKGAAWAKANLSVDRLRDIQHYLELDEQVQFGCRDAKVTAEAKRASEAAARIEINSDADPTVPAANDPPKPGADTKKGTPKEVKKKVHKSKSAKISKGKESKADSTPHPPVFVQSQSGPEPSAAPAETSSFTSSPPSQDPSLPAFGFGETTVFPHSSP